VNPCGRIQEPPFRLEAAPNELWDRRRMAAEFGVAESEIDRWVWARRLPRPDPVLGTRTDRAVPTAASRGNTLAGTSRSKDQPRRRWRSAEAGEHPCVNTLRSNHECAKEAIG
jgi:hypothetical protein